jgi:hypothetical protein
MDISEQAEVFQYLKTKGYNLQESTPERLRFEKEDNSNVIIINNSTTLPVQIKTDNEVTNYLAADFKDLMKYLKETVE